MLLLLLPPWRATKPQGCKPFSHDVLLPPPLQRTRGTPHASKITKMPRSSTPCRSTSTRFPRTQTRLCVWQPSCSEQHIFRARNVFRVKSLYEGEQEPCAHDCGGACVRKNLETCETGFGILKHVRLYRKTCEQGPSAIFQLPQFSTVDPLLGLCGLFVGPEF